MTSEKRNDEIDLLEFFLKIFLFIKKNFWVLFLSVFIGGTLGFSAKFFTQNHYKSSLVINTYTISENFIIEYINNLNSIIKDENYNYLSEKMKIDSSLLVSIKEIKAESAYDEKEKKKLGYLTIFVNVNNNQILEQLSKGILNYINNEPYAKNEIEIYIENNKNLISKIDEEIKKIEVLQEMNIFQNQNNADVNIYNSQKSFQNELLELIKEKQNREKSLKFAVPFRIIQDFTIYQKPVSKTISYTLIGGIIFGFLALFFLIIKNLNNQIKNLE
ncbi:MAG: hypothetical protein A2041_00410 [Bacteroidetes bacterium GWA2_31_9b]|nr:MAG: hypothetical protein A2041_00410 [Bacteroidetes bacterium GWA2_31_9b]